jgi:ATP-binding cassette subfamily C protein
MDASLAIDAGAPRALPHGTIPWRVTRGQVEVYLVSPERRRLIALIGTGAHVFPLAEGPLVLSLVAVEPAELIGERNGAGLDASAASWLTQLSETAGIAVPMLARESIAAFTASLDARFAELDAARDARLTARLARSTNAAPAGETGLAAAIAEAARNFGVGGARIDRCDEADFLAVPALARRAGFRAGQVILQPGWHRDDMGGPLLLRGREGGITLARWRKRAWRDPWGHRIDPADTDSLAFRLYPPLMLDLSRFANMGRSVLAGLRTESGPILATALGAALLGLLVPIATAWIFDDIVPAGAGGLLVSVGLALGIAAFVSTALGTARMIAVTRVAGRGQVNMAAGVADHVLRLPARFFKTIPAGDFNERLASLEGIRALVTDILLTAGLTLGFATLYLVLLFVYEPRVAAAGLVLTLVYVAAIAISRALRLRPLREAAERGGKLAGLTFEILDSLPKLRSAAAEPRALARWSRAYAAERTATAAGERIGNHFTAFSDAWQIVTLMGLFAVAAMLAAGDVAPGAFIAFLAAFAIFQGSFTAFCDSLLAIYTARPLADRVRPILSAAQEAGIGRADPGLLTGDIQASGLTFTYTEGTAPLIDGLSFQVRPGEHLAIVGGSGSGKSTILRLLLGFERPSTGSLTYDGQELASLDPARIRGQIGVVLQSSQLFAGTINENIRGASGATLEQCMTAAERAGLEPDLKLMPMGLHTPVTEGGGTLSGGQRQRILIARALVMEPAILFFDEATSALDNATQAVVARTLDSLAATRVTIAHRLSTVREADRIAVLERGRFIETGTFAELMAKDGAFAALAKRQLLED